MDLTYRQRLLSRWSALQLERSSYMPHWQELSQYFQPRMGKFLGSDPNRGGKKHNSIIDNTGTRSSRVLASGLMAGMTSPARPWFRVETSDPDLMEAAPVKLWCDKVTKIMRMIFSQSNIYRALHSNYEELGLFGTSSSILMPNFDNVMHAYPMTAGEYAIAMDAQGRVNTHYRQFAMSAGNMVDEFGLDVVSTPVKGAYDRGNYDSMFEVLHVIEPRKQFDPRSPTNKNMPIASCYLELGAQNQEGKFLRESGFKRFNAVVARWGGLLTDTYGSSPGMDALGDVKQLQHDQLRKSQGVDYMVQPSLQVPTQYKGAEKSKLPGGVFYVDSTAGNQGVKSAFEVQLNLQHMLADIQDIRSRVKETFYEDLFLMLANDTRSGVTAREIVERHEEKLLMLGPVLERLHNELLKPLIDITFDQMVTAGLVPTPPQELQGSDLNVQFVSVLAQAQRSVGLQGIDRMIGTITALQTLKPGASDKFDADQAVDVYADLLGVDPQLIVADDKVALVRQDRAKQQAQQQAMAAAPQVAGAAKDFADASQKNNQVGELMRGLTGYT
jgi:Bacteriophage head to tail connecting protein